MQHLSQLSDFILLSKEERTKHIDLSAPCFCKWAAPLPRYRHRKAGSTPRRQEVLDFFGLYDDVDDWRKSNISRNHACQNDSSQGWCANPLHLYLGTRAENGEDAYKDGRHPEYDRSGPNLANKGKGTFIDENGNNIKTTVDDAKERGLQGATKGRKWEQTKRVECPQCGKKVSRSGGARTHFDNCVAKEGSFRWFALELKKIMPLWRQRESGHWHKWTK